MVDWCGFGRHPVGSDKHREQADAEAVDSDEDDEEATSPIVTVSLPVWDFNCLFLLHCNDSSSCSVLAWLCCPGVVALSLLVSECFTPLVIVLVLYVASCLF